MTKAQRLLLQAALDAIHAKEDTQSTTSTASLNPQDHHVDLCVKKDIKKLTAIAYRVLRELTVYVAYANPARRERTVTWKHQQSAYPVLVVRLLLNQAAHLANLATEDGIRTTVLPALKLIPNANSDTHLLNTAKAAYRVLQVHTV